MLVRWYFTLNQKSQPGGGKEKKGLVSGISPPGAMDDWAEIVSFLSEHFIWDVLFHLTREGNIIYGSAFSFSGLNGFPPVLW